MGYPDGYYYGQGRIICDTSTFSVGDTIRVRSMTDSSKIWDKQVVTVGTALVFTVPCYDYYKICTVQEIDNVETEIGGVYKTVDFGQTLFIDVIDKTTLGGIQGILNAHQHNNLMATGDEVTIKVNGVDVVFQDAGHDLYESNEIIFVAKEIYAETVLDGNAGHYYANSAARTLAQDFYSNMDNNDKQYLKDMQRYAYNSTNVNEGYTDKVWIPSMHESVGLYANTSTPPPTPQHQFPLFLTQANRIKTYNGTARAWWTTDAVYNNAGSRYVIGTGGAYGSMSYNSFQGLLPCFRLTADS